MNWLNKVVDELIMRHPDGEIIVSSGVSPSGAYHLGTLREVMTAEIIHRELQRRGRQSRHIHVSDDLDVFRKVPSNIPADYEKYLGMPLCDIPAPDGSDQSYADYYLSELPMVADRLKLKINIMRASEKYRDGFFVPAIEKALANVSLIRRTLEEISGHKLDENWSPVQVMEGGYLKNRKFVRIDEDKKELVYEDVEGKERATSYQKGEVKLNWRIDWPARWWLLGVNAEPFGRDHATKGGSYDTGKVLVKEVFGAEAPISLPYDFINRTGDTKKMSKSSGDTITAGNLVDILPAELIWFFVIRYSPDKLLFFDEGPTLIRLFDEFAELISKPDKSEQEKQLLELCMYGIKNRTVSNIPFTHLVASYQASLKDVDKTIEVIKRTEHAETAEQDAEIIRNELRFIDNWLQKRAPEDVKFDLAENVDSSLFSDAQKAYLTKLADKIAEAPEDADGEWFHKAVYEFKDSSDLTPKELFITLYKVLINKESGPRAGWFLSILPREWLVSRLKLEN